MIKGRLCTCGVPGNRCDFWKSVFGYAFGGVGEIDPYEMDRVRRCDLRSPGIMKVTIARMLGVESDIPTGWAEALDNVRRLYRSIQSVTGCEVIVDSSKRPGYGLLLDLIPEIDLHVVHLLRDPRGVAFSWLRRKARPSVNGKDYMQRYTPSKTAWRWSKRNVAVDILWRHSAKWITLRYEDFIENPKQSVQRVVDLVQVPVCSFPFTQEKSVRLGINHSVRGNPSRFRVGEIELQLDEEWKEDMRSVDRRVVAALTWPLMVKYGYLNVGHCVC